MEKIIIFLKQFGWLVVLGVVGIIILIYGLWGELWPEKATVDIVKANVADRASDLIVIDVAGAVQKPGLYKLPSGSRIGDALVTAQGLSASADRDWVSKNVNLAEVVKDGGKVYVPSKTERETPPQSSGKGTALGVMSTKVNINTASQSELDNLAGIGEVRAQTIIASRPYGNLEELVSKAKIPQSVYDKIKDQVSIY